MKLKSIASLCKSRKTADICTDTYGNQYLGNGSAYYLMPAELELDEENILFIFDVPKDKQADWMVKCMEIPQYLPVADIEKGETQAETVPIELVLYDGTYKLLKDEKGIIIFNEKYLAPLADITEPINYYIRWISTSEAFVAVKKGLMLQALIAASNESIFTPSFLETFREVEDKVADWMNRRQGLKINLETGELED